MTTRSKPTAPRQNTALHTIAWVPLREALDKHVLAVLGCADPLQPYLVIVLASGQEIEIDLDDRLDEWSNGASALDD